ncbi:MAG TPA: phosphate ABC transporter substrate-binding protein PstS [Anaerolineaceae bacterium]
MRRTLSGSVLILLAAALLLSACASPSSGSAVATPNPSGGSAAVTLNGAGATFPQPVYSQWIQAYEQADPSAIINYQGIGSGGGKKSIIDGTVDFAGSDALLTLDEYSQGKDLQMLPAVAGAVVLIYNLPGLTETDPALVLDRQTLVGIYNATITHWNDPALLALNPALKSKLPNAAITAVHRSDGSGTTEMFTRALSAFSPDWKAGAAQSVQWLVDKAGSGVGGKGNPGVAATVQNTPNSIGYVELQYAVGNKMTYAQMINKAGKTVGANAQSLASAMNDFTDKFTDQLTNIIVDGPGADSWPICGYTYIIIHTTSMKDPAKAQALLKYLEWTQTSPQAAQVANILGYAAVPKPVQDKVIARLHQVTVNGKAVLTQ